MDIVSKFYMPGAVFVLTLASGFWLSNVGKPLNSVIFTIHKIISLGAVILIGKQIFRLLKVVELQSLMIALISGAGLCVIALFATGALMSVDKPAYDTFQRVHQVALVLMTVGLVGVVYLFAGRLL